MILTVIAIICAVIFISTFVVWWFLAEKKSCSGLLCLSLLFLAISCVLCLATMTIHEQATTEAEYLQAEYSTIMNYYNDMLTIENEYMRFDFYERVNEYNALLVEYQANCESNWIGNLYDAEAIADLVPVDFYLNGGEYGG